MLPFLFLAASITFPASVYKASIFDSMQVVVAALISVVFMTHLFSEITPVGYVGEMLLHKAPTKEEN